ncbi:DUF4198 domain-containing protein [Oligoflexus tunisiensis]|uniref:DUF4198 domain-containing protein n=1 Tax=Oligoflexus tunisiensis TaxID=708132 RepID=UPI00114CF6F4|nr:DUF4198 domain-containing protein [Oligoflexus tunisiensis]
MVSPGLLIHKACIAGCLLLLSRPALAHSRWILPSHTVLSGQEAESVSLDVSVSNEIFFPDLPLGGPSKAPADGKKKGPPRPDVKLQVKLPDGKTRDIPVTPMGRKSVGTWLLDQSGTFRFTIFQDGMKFTEFESATGKPERRFGEFVAAAQLPSGSKNIKHVRYFARIETFVSRNGQAGKALDGDGKGMEVKLSSHPNDLFTGETTDMQILIAGKPIEKGVTLNLIPGGTRHRNDRETVTLTTNDKGVVSIKWPKAGFYLLEAEYARPGKTPLEEDRYSLFVTLEVFPS